MLDKDAPQDTAKARSTKASAKKAPRSRVIKDARPGLAVERFFTREGVDPFSEVEWARRQIVNAA